MKRNISICALALVTFAIRGSATLNTMTTPSMGLLPQPPASLLRGQLFSQEYIFVFLEQQHVTLTAPLAVDVTLPGTYTMRSQLMPTTIPAGTVVNSYYVHANPMNQSITFGTNSIGFTTDESVIGVMLGGPTLAGGVPAVGIPETIYNTANSGNGFKLAAAGTGDTITISADQHTITFFEESKQKAITEFRIITTTVPVP